MTSLTDSAGTDCALPAILAAMAPPSRPRSTSQRSDSGSRNTSTGTSSSGSTPPIIRMPRQPTVASSCAATSPPSAEPIVKPQNIRVTRLARRAWGQYSLVSVIVVGIAPPRPRPVRKRSTSRLVMSVANADSSEVRPKKATDRIRIGLRP